MEQDWLTMGIVIVKCLTEGELVLTCSALETLFYSSRSKRSSRILIPWYWSKQNFSLHHRDKNLYIQYMCTWLTTRMRAFWQFIIGLRYLNASSCALNTQASHDSSNVCDLIFSRDGHFGAIIGWRRVRWHRNILEILYLFLRRKPGCCGLIWSLLKVFILQGLQRSSNSPYFFTDCLS